MKQAKAIFLGGELVGTENTQYFDYFNKGLICPFCQEKVFFAKEFERVIEGKTIKVSASFKHHKENPLSSSCELRSQSSEGKEILKVLSSESQEQRKLLWKKYLWAMFKAGVYANKDISRFGLSDIGKRVLETPLSKPINLKLLVDEDTPQQKYISVEELGFVLAYVFSNFLPFSYDYKKDLPQKLEDLINISNQIKSIIIKLKNFLSTTHIKTNPSLHHSVCMEILKVLANRDLVEIHCRVLSFIFLNINESSPMPKDVVLGVSQLASTFRMVNRNSDHGQITAMEDIKKSLVEFFIYFYLEQIITIDWYELSQQPWQNLANKSDIIKVPSFSCGKGFGQTKHNKK